MKTKEIKTIDIYTLTWFDKINGNTYFAQRIVINYKLENQTTIYNKFQYGYSGFRVWAFDCMRKSGLLSEYSSLHDVETKSKIIVREYERKALKRELTHIDD